MIKMKIKYRMMIYLKFKISLIPSKNLNCQTLMNKKIRKIWKLNLKKVNQKIKIFMIEKKNKILLKKRVYYLQNKKTKINRRS